MSPFRIFIVFSFSSDQEILLSLRAQQSDYFPHMESASYDRRLACLTFRSLPLVRECASPSPNLHLSEHLRDILHTYVSWTCSNLRNNHNNNKWKLRVQIMLASDPKQSWWKTISPRESSAVPTSPGHLKLRVFGEQFQQGEHVELAIFEIWNYANNI